MSGAVKAARKPARQDGKKPPKSTSRSVLELLVIIAIAVGLALGIQAFVVKPYKIPSGSMEPTLKTGQRVLVQRIFAGSPHVGEIVVFHPPQSAEEQKCGSPAHFVNPSGGSACSEPDPVASSVNFIKRIVAGPGDVISIVEGHVIRNGVREKDSYIKECGSSPECNFPKPITIPAGHWFMMGDNRGDSDDSRFWGPVPNSWIIGPAIATYWPPDRIGIL